MKFVSKELVAKGWSSDEKYHVVDENGQHFLLRVSKLECKARKEAEFAVMKRVEALGLPMCHPIKQWCEQDCVYTLLDWIEGEDLESVLPQLSEQEQYRIGLEAGRLQRRIHSIPAPPEQESWECFYKRKAETRLQQYLDCPLKYEEDTFFIQCVRHRLPLIVGRPTVLQHGDFHCGNLMMDRHGHLRVIDFEKFDYGDPWEAFAAITWDVRLAPAFARGRVDGYFEGCPPVQFWQLFALYVSRGILTSLPWAIPFGKKEISTMRQQANEVLRWYKDGSDIPAWYRANLEWHPLTETDLPALLGFCQKNEEYYSYIKCTPELETLKRQLTVLPPETTPEQKRFVGLWKEGQLCAILDLILDWPEQGKAYIGWFMVAKPLQRAGLGRWLIREVCEQLRSNGYHTVRLGCVAVNLPGLSFWQACGFAPTGEVVDDIRLMEREL